MFWTTFMLISILGLLRVDKHPFCFTAYLSSKPLAWHLPITRPRVACLHTAASPQSQSPSPIQTVAMLLRVVHHPSAVFLSASSPRHPQKQSHTLSQVPAEFTTPTLPRRPLAPQQRLQRQPPPCQSYNTASSTASPLPHLPKH